uniref:Putative exported protein n=1 Tax=Yersinia enterocolitica TaxID=630 RepID=F2Q7Y7_YEREN|nr:putative exported protein [Yersinia enterocolitica]
MKLFFTALLMMSAIFISPINYAALTVVGDLGGELAEPYLDAVSAEPNEFSPAEKWALPSPPTFVSIAAALPVHTPELTPGAVSARALNLPGIPPIFIVGDDELSRQWLSLHSNKLQRTGATGFVVNVTDLSRLQSLNALVPEVEMAPVSGSDLARRLQLTHYPLLITEKGLTQ